MHFIFSTGSLYTYGVARCFALAAAAGFDGIELMVDHRWDTRQPSYLDTLIERYELPIRAVHTPFVPSVPGWPDDQPARIRKTVEVAEAVGADVVVHHLPRRLGAVHVQVGSRMLHVPVPVWDEQGGYRRWLETAYRAFCGRTSVTLCIENMPALRKFGRRWHIYRWNRVDEIGRFPHLTMDTTHLGTWGAEPADVYRRWNERVRHVHLSNFDGREHRAPEHGRLHLDRLLADLSADGYDGAVSLELSPDALDAGSDDDAVVRKLAASLMQCREWRDR